MSLKNFDDTKYYILCPAKMSTGGPKHLHQLGAELRNLNKKIFMVYYPAYMQDPVHQNYKHYNLSFTDQVEDKEKNILIVPEVNDSLLLSKSYKSIQKVLFWMSLDFFFITNFRSLSKYLKSLIKIPFDLTYKFNELTQNYFGNITFEKYLKIIYLNIPFVNVLKKKDFKLNLSQSYYQYSILKSKNVYSEFLNDFINNEFFKASKKISLTNKKNFICYNPSKSSNFMKRFIKMNSDLKFVPLQNYSMGEIIDILSKSKIYMDFGFHPGVDGLPRESAILKNCVITNREGSAFYSKAVPINPRYKFEEKKNNLVKIRNLIDKIFNNYESEIKNFQSYVDKLENEELNFKTQVKKIFNS